MIRALWAFLAVAFLGGCQVTAQQAQQIANNSLDAICANLSVVDMEFQSLVVPAHINRTAQQAEKGAVAAITGICNSRPITNTPQALAAASAAFANVLTAVAAAHQQAGV